MNASAQSLLAAYDAGEPLTITVPHGGKRIVAGLVIVENGLVFADVGWSWWGNVRHPFHYVSGGNVHGKGPWYVGYASVDRLRTNDPLMEDYISWQRSAQEHHAVPRAAVKDALERYARHLLNRPIEPSEA